MGHYKDQWINAFEQLEEELGREPTEDEITDYISGLHAHICTMEDR